MQNKIQSYLKKPSPSKKSKTSLEKALLSTMSSDWEGPLKQLAENFQERATASNRLALEKALLLAFLQDTSDVL